MSDSDSSLINMLVYPRDEFFETRARAATLRQKLQMKLAVPPSHNVEQSLDTKAGTIHKAPLDSLRV